MKPILLKGHERSITYVKYNREGDLLFSCSKDKRPTLWRGDTGERVGTYDGHNGAVYCLDVTRDSRLLLTASADQSAKLWAVATGACLFTFAHRGPVKSVAWSDDERFFVTSSDPFGMEIPASINIYEFASKAEEQTAVPVRTIVDTEAPRNLVSNVAWLPLNAGIVATYADGTLAVLDPATGERMLTREAHDSNITSLSFNRHKTLAITSSTDRRAKLWDVATWEVLKTFETDTPLNGASISPLREHVVMGGGQEARDVTTTAATAGKFEARFHHIVLGVELGRIKGHFGPINTITFSPDGRSYASGGEDGYVRLHHLDEAYDRLGEEMERELEDPSLGKALEEGMLEKLEAEEKEAQAKAEAAAAATAAAISTAASAGAAAPVPSRAKSGLTGLAALVPDLPEAILKRAVGGAGAGAGAGATGAAKGGR